MADKSKPVSLRLSHAEFEQLQARAYQLLASPTGVARDLIRTGLVGGDNKALAERLMHVERRLTALEQQGRDTHGKAHGAELAGRDLLAKFDALLAALSGESIGRAA
jgi:hypothetical protein